MPSYILYDSMVYFCFMYGKKMHAQTHKKSQRKKPIPKVCPALEERYKEYLKEPIRDGISIYCEIKTKSPPSPNHPKSVFLSILPKRNNGYARRKKIDV